MSSMNPQSLDRANSFLAAVAARTEVGGVLPGTPADIGHQLAFPDALSTARAVRALIARRRLEPADGSYRLLDARPVEPGANSRSGRWWWEKDGPKECGMHCVIETGGFEHEIEVLVDNRH